MTGRMANAAQRVSSVQDSGDSFRESVRLAARRFKAGWLELGKLLSKVQNDGTFKAWGYPSFEAYCSKEIRIRKATALKLTRGYSFLSRHEPEAVEGDLAARAPPFEVIEVLAEAEQRGQLAKAEYEKVRDSIWQMEHPTSELKRQLEERFPRPKLVVSPSSQLQRLAAMAKKLAQELSGCAQVPEAVSSRAQALAEDVQELALSGEGDG